MRHTTKDLTNKKMNNDTYALRQQAMSFIYEAKALVPTLPRINVRVTDDSDDGIMGVGNSKTNTIWLPQDTINSKRLKEIVFHEVVHAAFGLGHYKGCKLMDASASLNPSSSELDALLVKYSKMPHH